MIFYLKAMDIPGIRAELESATFSTALQKEKRAPPCGNLILNLAFSKSEGLFLCGPGDQIQNHFFD